MIFERTIQKVLGTCATDNTNSIEKETERMTPSPSPPQQNGALVKLTSLRESKLQEHNTFPQQDLKKPHPSHFKTSPASTSDDMETVSPQSPSPPNGPASTTPGSWQRIRPVRRRSTLELHENPAYHPQGGPDYLKILAKYKLFDTDERHGRIVARFVNTGSAKERHPQVIKVEEYSANGNQEFLADITVGDPPQVLRVDLDTGSSDFWVFSTLLKPDDQEKAKKKHTIFDHVKSKSWRWPSHEWGGLAKPWRFRRPRIEWEIEYGDGSSASGVVGFDDVLLGDINISRQAVQLAKRFSGRQFREGSADGILGLAFGHLNSVNTVTPDAIQTPLENMRHQGNLKEHLFTVNLGKENFFTFGFIDEATRQGRDIHWVDVDSKGGFWKFDSRYARVGGKLLNREFGSAIADTGSNLILTHPQIVWMIYKRIKGARYDSAQPGWVYPAGAEIPEISFSVGEDQSCMIEINEHNMNHSELGGGYVFGAVQENPAYENRGTQFDIFGTPFFRQIYAIFDIKGERFGLIKKEPEEIGKPETRALLVESPTKMGIVAENDEEEVEDSVDGSIREEYPRRGSTLQTVMSVAETIHEEEQAPVIKEEDEVTQITDEPQTASPVEELMEPITTQHE